MVESDIIINTLLSLFVLFFSIGFILAIYSNWILLRIIRIAKKLNPKKKYSYTDFNLIYRLRGIKDKRVIVYLHKRDLFNKIYIRIFFITLGLFILMTILLLLK